jgi:uncharacterized protein YqjF (DUF2071 family)
MAGATPEEHVRLPILRCAWRTMTFVHWPVSTPVVQGLLPAGLTVDEHDGTAWVSLAAFLMADVRPPGLPALPRVSTFPETNLRTYVRGPDGRDGLWFFSLDVASAMTAVAARLLTGAPYFPGRLTVDDDRGTTTYEGARNDGKATYRLVVRTGAPLEASERDAWLTGRWRAYTRNANTLLVTPVQHEPWPLVGASVQTLEETLTGAAGLPSPVGEPVVHFSDGVHDVRIGPSRPVGRA